VSKRVVFGTISAVFIEFLATQGHDRDGRLLQSLRFFLFLCYILRKQLQQVLMQPERYRPT
jgi:hypothetical protein